ncbi:hypothetical protein NPIL_194141 [Nephila pilipes]|uniref:Uncharacterized protein n=1 Tax=Nephila pilipes TaxID=299642 RepID=A0A8X6MT31_NEPPI|nr:hypothetical protein NPIL_194141 [Nephila pilipes]
MEGIRFIVHGYYNFRQVLIPLIFGSHSNSRVVTSMKQTTNYKDKDLTTWLLRSHIRFMQVELSTKRFQRVLIQLLVGIVTVILSTIQYWLEKAHRLKGLETTWLSLSHILNMQIKLKSNRIR